MKNSKHISIVIVLIILMFAAGVFCGYRLSRNTPDEPGHELISTTSYTEPVSPSPAAETETGPSVPEESIPEECFNYLAIGNSITRHRTTDFWWNPVGMAASDEEHDYYHIVLGYLENRYGNVNGVIYNFSPWEGKEDHRDEEFKHIDKYLDPDLDLITIQMGENVSDLSTYQEDYITLLKYIHEKAPNARILVIGDFWTNEERDRIEFYACAVTCAEYVSLDGIAGNDEYYCGLGTTVYDKDGNEHTVENEGVAMHPGDAGMQAIAERIIEALEN